MIQLQSILIKYHIIQHQNQKYCDWSKKSNITILNNEVEKNYLITKYCDSIYNNNTIHPYILSFYTIFVRFHASIIRWCVNDCNSENAPSANNLVVDSLLERNHVLKFNKWRFFPIKWGLTVFYRNLKSFDSPSDLFCWCWGGILPPMLTSHKMFCRRRKDKCPRP